MMTQIKKVFVLALTVLAVSAMAGCVSVNLGGYYQESVSGEGDMMSTEYPVSDFTKLRVDASMEVIYTAMPSNIIKIEIQENLLEYIEVSTTDGMLQVKADRTFKTSKENTPKLYVSAPTLEELIFQGTTRMVKSDAIEGDKLKVTISGFGNGDLDVNVKELSVNVTGAADLNIEGIADDAKIVVSGSGSINAGDLITQTADLSISGAGDMSIHCEEELNARVSGAGNVSYSGSPSKVDTNVSGAGSIKEK